MGLSDQDIVALSGGHTLVRCISCSVCGLYFCHYPTNYGLFVKLYREGATRSDQGSRGRGPQTLLFSITHTSSKLMNYSAYYFSNAQFKCT